MNINNDNTNIYYVLCARLRFAMFQLPRALNKINIKKIFRSYHRFVSWKTNIASRFRLQISKLHNIISTWIYYKQKVLGEGGILEERGLCILFSNVYSF